VIENHQAGSTLIDITSSATAPAVQTAAPVAPAKPAANAPWLQ
jgi:hypothetical protein